MAVPKSSPQTQLLDVRVLPDGTVRLPSEVVRAAGFPDGATLSLSIARGELRLVSAASTDQELKKQPLLDLYDAFSEVREEVVVSGITEDELNELIDEAIAESRQARATPKE